MILDCRPRVMLNLKLLLVLAQMLSSVRRKGELIRQFTV